MINNLLPTTRTHTLSPANPGMLNFRFQPAHSRIHLGASYPLFFAG